MEMKDKIKFLREKNGLTLEDVGKVVGVGKSTVRKWETGDIANMRRDKIAKLAEALHTSPAYLMGWEYDEDSTSDEMLALMMHLSEEAASGRPAAADDLIKRFGAEHSTNMLRIVGSKTALLYYHAFDDSRSASAGMCLLELLEKLVPSEAEHLELLVSAYYAADERSRQMVDLALDPFLSKEEKEWTGSLVRDDASAEQELAHQILHDKRSGGGLSASNGDDGKKKEA